MATNLVQIENDAEIKERLEAERSRLRKIAGLDQPKHFHRPVERAFTAEQRKDTTILFGGFTWKHEDLIRAVFQGCGYRCEKLPVPDVPAFQIGKEFGNNGQCNPTYFTVGNLVQYLQFLEKEGLSRQEILDNYVFFTAGSCGPCRFGMYEAEYRFALKNAGFDGFRVLLFKDSDGIKAASGEPGLKFSIDFGFGMLNAMHMGDVINDLIFQIRPYEVNAGETDRVFHEMVEELCEDLRKRKSFEIEQSAPNWLKPKVKSNKILRNTFNVFGKWHEHMWGKDYLNALKTARAKMDSIEIDRTRVKPVVKITGEFWAQTTEGDGNFHMFEFLEREGAQVLVEPIATWVAYLMYQAKAHAIAKWPVNRPHRAPKWHEVKKNFANYIGLRKKLWGIGFGERMWKFFYHRTAKNLGGITHHLAPQTELAELAHPFYNQFARGGEGHLEVGKNVYYTVHKLAHMVLALKPFGCMPSSQSDGVQSAVINKFKDMIFLPIETSGEGEVNAHSRVQMALGEAKVKAKTEFEQCLKSTGKTMTEIREYIDEHPELKRPFYHVPHREGVAGTAAQFILHVSDRINKDRQFRKRSRVRVETAPAMGD
ncbi:MAG TPA: activator of (R)-2-hydroxyglutaryl-CoA dehydratase [Verrucomicrobiae bacterium]|jgi:predicted nucleotide-binding protein (sugar kinase/HSP70/actin superfamily)|nr:activator of (R)-2-hydroxyglutaryl-CoA dehydratase [Verrucomicrobiae bacterium]